MRGWLLRLTAIRCSGSRSWPLPRWPTLGPVARFEPVRRAGRGGRWGGGGRSGLGCGARPGGAPRRGGGAGGPAGPGPGRQAGGGGGGGGGRGGVEGGGAWGGGGARAAGVVGGQTFQAASLA